MSDGSKDEILIFGGSFDPIQEGHVDVLHQIIAPNRKIIIAPTLKNPWKEQLPAPFHARLRMIELVLEAEILTDVLISTFPYERSIELLRHLREEYPNTNLRWVIGESDQDSAKSWLNWEKEGVPFYVVKERIAIHASAVRDGEALPHPAIRMYIQEHQLYPAKRLK